MSRRFKIGVGAAALLYVLSTVAIIITAFQVQSNTDQIQEIKKKIVRIEKGVVVGSGGSNPGGQPGGQSPAPTPSPGGGSAPTVSVPPVCIGSLCTPSVGVNLP